MEKKMDDIIIYIVIFSLVAVWYFLTNIYRSRKGKKADMLFNQGSIGDAIKLYRQQLLSALELSTGSWNKDNPATLLSDAKNDGMEIMLKLEQAYTKAGVDFSTEKYQDFIDELEEFVENKDNYNFTKKLNGKATKTLKQFRNRLATYIKSEMPNPSTV